MPGPRRTGSFTIRTGIQADGPAEVNPQMTSYRYGGIGLTAAIAMVVALGACGGGGDDEQQTADQQVEDLLDDLDEDFEDSTDTTVEEEAEAPPSPWWSTSTCPARRTTPRPPGLSTRSRTRDRAWTSSAWTSPPRRSSTSPWPTPARAARPDGLRSCCRCSTATGVIAGDYDTIERTRSCSAARATSRRRSRWTRRRPRTTWPTTRSRSASRARSRHPSRSPAPWPSRPTRSC